MTASEPVTGQPAGVLVRIAAFTIDTAVVAVIASVTWFVSMSWVFGALLGAEALLALWVLQARTGTSPGKAICGLRVTNSEAPFSPGAGRSFVRGSIVMLGAGAFIVGAWLVQASAGWDRSGQRRSWADRAAQTRVVVVPIRTTNTPAAAGHELPSPTVTHHRVAPAADEGHYPAPRPDASAVGLPAQVATTRASDPATPAPPIDAGIGSNDVNPVGISESFNAGEEVLLIFDTGQRVRLPIPSAVNFGRQPAASLPTDMTCAVDDPDKSVSRTHLRLELDSFGAWIIDLGATNGTDLIDVDGSVLAVTTGVRTLVDADARVRIGNRVFTVSRLIGDPA